MCLVSCVRLGSSAGRQGPQPSLPCVCVWRGLQALLIPLHAHVQTYPGINCPYLCPLPFTLYQVVFMPSHICIQ